ncbi:hypothetical protein LAG90_15635 [Marinilongibacter aquaticus]|uniref:hypothetical protein n=1 Tax=Marinilongibacter aquaticus TaxID=2975157 RepID=UPI0021BD7DC0|nr:hypothetical protein [Marinilongibacter aquaticus]UBM58235.1 hypothetical protein LAG90_15635 [Marinilongibacter aquaticus]
MAKKRELKKYSSGRIQRLLKIDDSELTVYFKYYLNEIDFEDLLPSKQEKLQRFQKIWSMMCMGRTKEMIVNIIKKDHGIEQRQAEIDYRFTQKLYGKLNTVEVDGRRAASREYFDMLSQLALKDKQYIVAVSAREKADDLAGLHKEEKEGFDPAKFDNPSKIIFNVQVNNYGDSKEDSETIALDE